ncbi:MULTISPECIES: DNA cytosine methyltransferase [unclassified Coleofasciculus]|uniref:DNA cytosine methyltransferase n=1 Tax=unclassified Coleofasciculus TaxID=2692782 RepID=UPI00187F7458|nr:MULTISPECIES: DNA cytosine methyltransferase [unclassified Coleofasciculus]MBE9126863.1 DNA cytosine methyltransferase [Coleofasciculus sp. LEGE 07081]MBE9150228.1 DNA cytosine methyltransferase [Coleofasciculus sp. LEGE 07092]
MANFGHRPVAIDLFAGVGGFSLGIEQAGFDVAVAVEKDPIHAAVYAYNFPHTRVLCSDIFSLKGTQIQEVVRNWSCRSRINRVSSGIDLVFGGPPCQGFSLMGKRQVDDPRNSLVFEFCRLVKELQPRYFVMENVPGLGQRKYQQLLEQLVYEFQAGGYEITKPVQVLNAVNFGVPQQRKRLFLLGTQVGAVPLTYPEPQLRSPSQFRTVGEAIADLPNLDEFAALQASDCVELTPPQLQLIQALAMPYAEKLRGVICDPENFAHIRHWNPRLLTSSLQTQHNQESIERFHRTKAGELEPISRLQRLDWNKPCYTLRAGTGCDRGSYTSPRPIHPHYPRVLSVREAARLHSFPDWFRFHITKWHGFRQVGNAVPPLLGRALGYQIIMVLKINPSVPTIFLELGDTQLLTFRQSQASQYWKLQIKGCPSF